MTEVTTGWSFQALKLLLMMKVAEKIPKRTIAPQTIRAIGVRASAQKYVPWIVDEEQNLEKSSPKFVSLLFFSFGFLFGLQNAIFLRLFCNLTVIS